MIRHISHSSAGRKCRARGFSMVEFMISMTLGLLLVAAIGYVYLGSRQTFRTLDDFSRTQENIRYALETIGVDARMAGYSGCVNLSSINPANPASTPLSVIANAPSSVLVSAAIRGYPDGAGKPASIPASGAGAYVAGTDVLHISRAASTGLNVTGNMTATNANIQIGANATGIVAEQALLISDCVSADLFRATNTPSGGSGTIAHTGANCSNIGMACNTDNNLSKNYGNDAEIYIVIDNVYYIGINPAGNRALYVIEAGAAPQELVENVQDMELRFGVDTNTDFAIDAYVASGGVTDWRQVLSARVNLVFVSNSNNVATSPQPYVVEGVTTTPGASDRRLYQVATATFGLRNRLP